MKYLFPIIQIKNPIAIYNYHSARLNYVEENTILFYLKVIENFKLDMISSDNERALYLNYWNAMLEWDARLPNERQ